MTENSDHFYYFAFGSNLLKERIHVQRCTIYWKWFAAKLSVRMGAVASIEPVHESYVYGCIYKVPESFAEELDRQESGYDRHEVTIHWVHSNSTVVCRTYRYAAANRKSQLPSPHYKEVIVAGAKQHQLPDHYVCSALPHNGFNGRVELDLEALKHLNM